VRRTRRASLCFCLPLVVPSYRGAGSRCVWSGWLRGRATHKAARAVVLLIAHPLFILLVVYSCGVAALRQSCPRRGRAKRRAPVCFLPLLPVVLSHFCCFLQLYRISLDGGLPCLAVSCSVSFCRFLRPYRSPFAVSYLVLLPFAVSYLVLLFPTAVQSVFTTAYLHRPLAVLAHSVDIYWDAKRLVCTYLLWSLELFLHGRQAVFFVCRLRRGRRSFAEAEGSVSPEPEEGE